MTTGRAGRLEQGPPPPATIKLAMVPIAVALRLGDRRLEELGFDRKIGYRR